MKRKSPDPAWFDFVVKAYRLFLKVRWSLAEKRMKWQRRAFHDSLTLFDLIRMSHIIKPFWRTTELDAAIFAFKGEAEKVTHCLDHGVSPNLKGLMEIAIFSADARIVELLLSRGADPNRVMDWNGRTILHEAAAIGPAAIVELLLAKGADPNRKTRDEKKPLWYAYDRRGDRTVVKLLEPVTQFDKAAYEVEDFLKMKDPEKAYYAFCAAIREGFRHPSAAELRILCLTEFLGLCLANGFTDLYWQATWAVVPSAELLEGINEPELARMMRQCIAIVTEYGKRTGRHPFDDEEGSLELDEETEARLNSPELDFLKYDCDYERFCRKTMDYVRKNRVLFEA